MSDVYTQWAIYDHPKDYPHNFVVRQWHSGKIFNAPVADQECYLATTLEEARRFIPQGLVRTPRLPDDDAVIAEVWI